MVQRRPNSLCMICGAGFYCPPSRKAIGYGKYCSKACMGESKRGRRDPNLTHRIPKGNVPWNKGSGRKETKCPGCGTEISVLESQGTKYCSRECAYASMRLPDNMVTNYSTVHSRIKKQYGTPSRCENCGDTTSPKFEWANISGEYRLDRSDWARLCCQCHRRYDFGTKNKIELSI